MAINQRIIQTTRITKIEVELSEQDVNTALVEYAIRELGSEAPVGKFETKINVNERTGEASVGFIVTEDL